ncbi:MAG: glycosyltransferase [bacterium]|nr:glycosyltransferase [bacterium]
MKVALAHDFLTEYGGAERVLEALHEIWPDAPVYTAFCDPDGLGPHKERFANWKIKTSWAQHVPFFKKLYSPLRFLAPYLWNFDFSKYDVVISSTNMYFAKNIPTSRKASRGKPAVHICYCHTPARALYGYATQRDWKKRWYIRIYVSLVNHFLRIMDFKAAQKPDFFIANSKEVQARIKKFYRRDSTVIYPPVEVSKVGKVPKVSKGEYFLSVGRLGAAKRVDVGIKAAQKAGVPLKVVGTGIEEESLKKMANSTSPRLRGASVEFLGEVSDEELAKLYAGCKAVLFLAQDEDFGIVPVEAMAYGKLVIAAASGGVVESVVDGVTGILLPEPLDVDELAKVLGKFDPKKFDSDKIRHHAEKFSKERFKKEIKEFVQKKYKKK